ncbi:MAG: hypothetical protein K9G33_10195 [Sneathiella sp.]|nr:hypothetical protein [Sneathiella sp.]
MNRLVVATIAFFSLTPLASAQMMPPAHHVRQDHVVLNLTTEGWVKTDTARVAVFVDLVQQKESAEDLKKRIDGSLQSLAKDVDWRFTSSRQQLDQTGLNRWYVTAEARVQEAKLAGLEDRAKSASSPGYKVGISYVDFTPSLAEFEKLRADLREDIYKQAIAEADRLNKVMPGPEYHVRRVDFVQAHPSMAMEAAPRTMMMKSGAADASTGSEGGAELLVSVKQSVSAEVILGRAGQPAPQ